MNEQWSVETDSGWKLTEDAAARIRKPILKAIEDGLIPGASVAISFRGSRICYAAGLAVSAPNDCPAGLDTLYDCASLTKVAVTLPLILQLCEQNRLGLDAEASAYLPELRGGGAARITIRELLAHTSGLPATHDFYSVPWSLERILAFIGNEAPIERSVKTVVYSDLGFIVLGAVASRLYGLPLDEAARRYLFEPLGMTKSGFCPDRSNLDAIAATEWSDELGGFWHGIVHDENARALGGVSGHAGLFSTAEDLLKYARLWLNPGGVSTSPLSKTMAREATKLQTFGAGSSRRGLGWVLKGDEADVSGALMTPEAFGHTGFTGTSLYVDPGYQLAAVLLTNRVHYGRHLNVTGLRHSFHEAVVRALVGQD
ncbi:serine hydrolase domain-containing protein [Cohnella sp.]|uniref:serine hydrolase domain-containing protein n=1 Tax=Cohnella sp. TaxID=1883426 RepID=UPI003563E2DC